MSTSSSPKPKRGAPYGNKNRQRHGRYAQPPHAAPSSPSAPPTASPAGSLSPGASPSPANRLTLTQEISYLRAYMIRTAIVGAATFEPGLTSDVLRALSHAATSLTRLIHTENWLTQTSGAQIQTDDFPRAFLNLHKVSKQILASLPHASPPRPNPDPDSQEDDPSPSGLLQKLALDLGIDLDSLFEGELTNETANAFPVPAPKLPADSPDHASDLLSRLDRLSRN